MPNITKDMIAFIAKQIEGLGETFVFTGGAITYLLITDMAYPQPRPTTDVDVIVNSRNRQSYYQLEQKLRELGFSHDLEEGAPLCRWVIGGIKVDVMPQDSSILGFTNIWYEQSLLNSDKIEIEEGLFINLIKAPYFIATKLEAFSNRGNNDYMASQDMEDVVTVIDGRKEIVSEINESSEDLKGYLGENFKKLLDMEDFVSCVPCHLHPDAASQKRVPIVLGRIKNIADLSLMEEHMNTFKYTNQKGISFNIGFLSADIPKDADFFGFIIKVVPSDLPERVYYFKALVANSFCHSEQGAKMWLNTTALDFLKQILETYNNGKHLILFPPSNGAWYVG